VGVILPAGAFRTQDHHVTIDLNHLGGVGVKIAAAGIAKLKT